MEMNHMLRQDFDLLKFHINNGPLAFIEWDGNFRVKRWSAKARQLFGYAEEEVKNLYLLDLKFFDAEDHEPIREKMNELMSGEQSSNTLETSIKTKSGDVLTVEFFNSALPDEAGKLISAVSFVHDVSPRKQVEEEIKQSLKEKEVLLAETHHRVKNNLALVSGLLELQAFNSGEEAVAYALRHSQSRINSMAMVHERLYQSDNLSELNSLEFVKKLAKSISEAHYNEHKNIDLKLNIDSFDLNVTQAIPLGLILNELLVNAFKHAFQDVLEGQIQVNLTKDDDHVCLSVSDNGKGIPDDMTAGDSQSLGLTLMKTLTKQLKGKLDVDNRDGSSFEIKFKIE